MVKLKGPTAMRLLIAGIMHETHTFSSESTTLDRFHCFHGEAMRQFAGANHSLGGAIDECDARGIDPALAFFAQATPAGIVPRETFESLVAELVNAASPLLPVDGVVLTLHGAMVAEGYPDAEETVVSAVRELVGDNLPIAVTLDFHANIGQGMIDRATIVTTYDTYPHVDIAERAREAVALLEETIRSSIRPTMALVKPPLMPVPQVQQTAIEPFRSLFERAHEMEEQGEALTVTVAGGFAYADVPDAGVSFLVTTDNDPSAAKRLATELADMLWSRREQLIAQNMPVADAVREAIASKEWPVVLVDVGDNVGGGTPGDATAILAELLAQDAQEATIVIADPAAAAQAIAAGLGSEITVEAGGKVDQLHGEPVRLTGIVQNITDGRWVHEGPENAGVPVNMGPSAVVRSGGVNVVLTSVKSMPGDLNQLRSVGIEPASQRILVVKASVRWRGGYEPIMARGILVDTPGLGSIDLRRFNFNQIRRPIYPLDEDTVWTAN